MLCNFVFTQSNYAIIVFVREETVIENAIILI